MIGDLDNVDFISSKTSILFIRKLCCMFFKTTKQWSRWSSREEARQWDMFPGPTELLLIGYLIESIRTPRSKSNTLTPRTNSQTYWQREILHVMNGNHLLFLFNISHFSAANCLEVMSKRTQEDAGEERVTAKSKSMMNLVSRCSVRDPNVLASAAYKIWARKHRQYSVIRITCTSNLEECSMCWIILIMFLQTFNFCIKKLCCVCLRTTKQWSRWK